MALIPGSYARAAGLQSEINKVTVTRVAGSEVQFRRTIDTYQRDLRYNVNQIGRQQRQLRRSMKKYIKKLHDSKKERKQRAAKAKQDEERLQLNVRQFQEVERAMKNEIVALGKPAGASSHHGDVNSSLEGASEPSGEGGEAGTASSSETLPDSPDSGLGGDIDDSSSPASSSSSDNSHKDNEQDKEEGKTGVFKGKVPPYFRAKRQGHTSKRRDGARRHNKMKTTTLDEQDDAEEQADDHDALLLPVINEENEEYAAEQNKTSTPAKTPLLEAGSPDLLDNPSSGGNESGVDFQKASTGPCHRIGVVVASLDTKTFSKQGQQLNGSGPDGRKDEDVDYQGDEGNAGMTSHRESRPRRRKNGVSYADLIKLQHTHTSTSKQLFRLVDRLASVHGIKDNPPPHPSSRSSSLDPRDNAKIKRRGDGPKSKMADGMVKQAAVLYSMKYGYTVPVDRVLPSVGDVGGVDPPLPPPVVVSLEVTQGYSAADRPLDVIVAERYVTMKTDGAAGVTRDASVGLKADASVSGGKRDGSVNGRRDSSVGSIRKYHSVDGSAAESVHGTSVGAQSRRLSVASQRRSSTDVTSPFYEFSEAGSSIFDEIVSDAGVAAPEHRSRSKTRAQSLSMAQLSRKASEVRERTLLEPPAVPPATTNTQSLHPNQDRQTESTTPRESQSLQKPLSPLPRRSRSLSRPRRDSVQNQLQRRLNEDGGDGEGGHMAWQSAFGRLKILHTLYDLSQHFSKKET